MRDLEVELGPNEVVVATQSFREGGELGEKAVLTTRRLVILSRGTRESHPLNKIQSIRIESSRNVGLIVTWSCMLFFGLAPAGLIGATFITWGETPGIADYLREQYPVVGGGLLLALCSVVGLVFAMRRFVRLAVELQSGAKTYVIHHQDSQLLSFVQKVEQSI